MPRCSRRLAQSLREIDLPVLPWLAPRVFQPWPFPGHQQVRSHSTSRNDSQSTLQCQHNAQSTLRRPVFDLPVRSKSAQHGRGFAHSPASGLDLYGGHNGNSRDRANQHPGLNDQSTASARSKHLQQWYQNIHGPGDRQGQSQEGHEAESRDDKGPRNGNIKSGDSRSPGYQKRPMGLSPRAYRALGLGTEKRPATQQDLYDRLRKTQRKVRVSMSRHQGRLGPQDECGFSKTRAKFVAIGRPVQDQISSTTSNKTFRSAPTEDEKPEDAGERFSFSPDDFSATWNLNYSRLNSRFDKTTDPTYSVHSDEDVILRPEAEAWAEAILSSAEQRVNRTSVLSSFKKKTDQRVSWNVLWSHAMLWILRNKPEQGVRFLTLTHSLPYVSRTWIEDSLAYLARHFTAGSDATGATGLGEALVLLMYRPRAPPLQLRDSQVRLLLPYLSVDQTLQLLSVIRTNHVYVHGQTLLHIASHLARSGALRESMECLLEAPEQGVNKDKNAFLSVCATILRQTKDQPEGLRICLTIIQNLVNIGVRINVQLCNIVILNAVEAGDLSTAFSVYHSLVDHGLQADTYTYAIILKGCKKAFKDTETLHSTIQSTVRGTDLTRQPTVAAEVLHCLYLFHFGSATPSAAWSNLKVAYRQMFDTKPLEALGIISPTTSRVTTQPLRQPPLAAIGIMLSAWLRTTSIWSPNMHFEVYAKFRQLAKSREAPFPQLAKTDYIFNVFLKTFCSKSNGLPYAADIIRDMQSSEGTSTLSLSVDDAKKVQFGEGDTQSHIDPDFVSDVPPSLCQPTVRSWSILLKGFTKAKKMDLAEQVLAYMRAKGIEPNLVTWNSLFDGYAGLRNPEGALTVYKRMEREGFGPDEYTEGAARKIGLSIEDLERENQQAEQSTM